MEFGFPETFHCSLALMVEYVLGRQDQASARSNHMTCSNHTASLWRLVVSGQTAKPHMEACLLLSFFSSTSTNRWVFPSILRRGHRDILWERHEDHRPDFIWHWLSPFFTPGPRTGLLRASRDVSCWWSAYSVWERRFTSRTSRPRSGAALKVVITKGDK